MKEMQCLDGYRQKDLKNKFCLQLTIILGTKATYFLSEKAAESVIVKRVFRAEEASLITNYSSNQGHIIMSEKKSLLRAASSKKCVIRKTQL